MDKNDFCITTYKIYVNTFYDRIHNLLRIMPWSNLNPILFNDLRLIAIIKLMSLRGTSPTFSFTLLF